MHAPCDYYRNVFEHANDAIFVHSARSGRILDVNHKVVELFGYEPEQLRRMTVADISARQPGFDHAESVRRIQSAAATGPQLFEWMVRSRDGREFPVEVNLKGIDLDGTLLILALCRDITERKVAQQQLVAREAYYRKLIASSADGIAIVAADGTVKYVGPSITNVLGYGERKAIGRNVLDWLHPKDAEQVRPRLAELSLSAEATLSFVYRILHLDGSWRNHEATCKNLLHDPGIGGILVNFRDVTARRRAELEARQRQRELEHVARCGTMGELASALAHELNQPLSALANFVGGCLYRLKQGQWPVEDMLVALEGAHAQAVRAGKIIGSMRNFTRRTELTRTVCDVNAIVADVLHFIEIKAETRGVQVRWQAAATPPLALCDQTLIEQVVLNIAFNGIESMEDTPAGERVLVLSVHPNASSVHVAIADQGHGLPQVNPDKIFDAFFTTKKDGMGIGLSLSRSIIDSHGGHVWVTSNRRGATFHFTLPAAYGTDAGDMP